MIDINAMLKELQDVAKESIKEYVEEHKQYRPMSWGRRAACYVCKSGELSVAISTNTDFERRRHALWVAVVMGYPIPFLTKDEATACAVQLLLQGLASRIIYRRPRNWG
jgi:hypothetical protein